MGLMLSASQAQGLQWVGEMTAQYGYSLALTLHATIQDSFLYCNTAVIFTHNNDAAVVSVVLVPLKIVYSYALGEF